MRWISCKENLPKDYEEVLVTIREKFYGDKNYTYHTDKASFYTDEENVYLYCEGRDDCGFGSFWNDWDEGQDICITHWMSLPEPYTN